MPNEEAPAAPFTFKPAAQKPARAPEEPAKHTRKKASVEPAAPEKKTRKRRARTTSDVAVLKACLRQLRTLDPKDALRTIETLRVLFK